VIPLIPLKSARYDDRNVLKDKGAKWNADEKYWYVPDGRDPVVFRSYMDRDTQQIFDAIMDHMNGLQTQDWMEKSKYERPDAFKAIRYPKLGLPDEFVVVDTETTGLGQNDEVVELSVLDSNANELYHSFFEPKVEVNYQAAQVTGLTNEKLVGQPKFADEWPKIKEAIGAHLIAGHNLQFDRRLMQQTLEKQTGKNHQGEMDALFENCIDSYQMAQRSSVAKGKRSLGQLCEAMGVEYPPNHRASHDCLGVLYVLQNFEQKDYGVTQRRLPDLSFLDTQSSHGYEKT
jgi:DNA polymerase-3 subunit epsilon